MKRKCSVTSCESTYRIKRGLCNAHYQRLARHGTTDNWNFKRRLVHGMTNSPTYRVWRNMHSRCENPNTPYYGEYGGRGIKVCERWFKFQNFLDDMGEKPEGESIDRVDNDKGYNPTNCKWSTPKEQAVNRRKRRYWKKPDLLYAA